MLPRSGLSLRGFFDPVSPKPNIILGSLFAFSRRGRSISSCRADFNILVIVYNGL
jgi:hypothetical protein